MVKRNRYSTAVLSNDGDMTVFTFGGTRLSFAAPYSLRRYVKVRDWRDGVITVDADYGNGIEEDYIDLGPVLKDLMMPKSFLRPIEKVEVKYV